MKTQSLYILGAVVVVGGIIYLVTRTRSSRSDVATSTSRDVPQIRPTMLPVETPVKDGLNPGDPGNKDMFVGFVQRTQARFK